MQESLQERLNKILEDFKSANDLKREIESKEVLTKNDKEELEIIENWLEEFRKEINDWAKEYNNTKNTPIEIPKSQEKTLKEQFDENRIKLNEIKYHSKSLQPKFESYNKRNKYEILTSLGFVETQTVDDRSILIHPTLVGSYYDLVKEQKRILEKIKEENKSKAEIVIKDEQLEIKDEVITEQEQENKVNELQAKFEKNQQELSRIMEGKNLGKKDYIKYKGVKYWIAKKYINRFKALMHEQELLSKELGKIEEKAQELELPVPISVMEENNIQLNEQKQEVQEDLFKVIETNLKKGLEQLENEQPLSNNLKEITNYDKQLPILYEQVINTKKDNGNIKTKIFHKKNNIIKSLITKLKSTKFYKKYKEYQEKLKIFKNRNLEETQFIIKAESNDKGTIRKNKIEDKLSSVRIMIAGLENKPSRTEQEEQDLRKLLELEEAIEKELAESNNNKTPINEEVKEVRKSKTNIKEKRNKKLKKILLRLAITAGLVAGIMAGIKSCNTPEQQPTVTKQNSEIDDNEEEKTKDEEQEPELEYFIDNEEYNITGNIYENMYDATKGTNPQQAYFGKDTNGYIVGWGVKLNDEMIFVSKNDNNYKETLENLMSQGGQVTTYAMSDINSGKETEITGFYNEDQIGRSR